MLVTSGVTLHHKTLKDVTTSYDFNILHLTRPYTQHLCSRPNDYYTLYVHSYSHFIKLSILSSYVNIFIFKFPFSANTNIQLLKLFIMTLISVCSEHKMFSA